MTIRQTITPCLWFDGQAEEAAEIYVSVFPNSRITDITRSGKDGPGPEGSALMVAFELDGQTFTGLNGGPQFKFTEAVSMIVNCDSQTEVDRYWDALTADGGSPSMCGWLKDRFGLSWQVVPVEIVPLLQDKERAGAVMAALMEMQKIDVARLKAAHGGI
jgi:predicted 3-demethylubiquinone-9 3-methyltransferase (glyoxalase superfamily)